MSETVELAASFVAEETCAHAIEALREAHVGQSRIFSPMPCHKIQHAIGLPPSPVRAYVLGAGISGVITGLLITIGTSWEWNLVAGGKPIVSWPPFIIICFELMILFGGTTALLTFMLMARVPAFEPTAGYRSRFSGDRFGVVVVCDEQQADMVETILKQVGAEEIMRDAA